MKSNPFNHFIVAFIITAFIASGMQAQSIHFESHDGVLKVNGNILRSENIPINLNLNKAHFSTQMIGKFPMRVSVNGHLYEVWEDSITEVDSAFDAHFRIIVDDEGGFMSVESYVTEDFARPTGRLSDHTGITSWAVSNLTTWNTLHDPTSMINFVQNFSQNNANRIVEFSNYLTNVRDASHELFELLRDEWSQEQEAMEMATKIQTLPEGAERDEAVIELEEKLNEIFSMKQDNRRMEINHLEMQINRLEERLRERSVAKDRLIDARMSELLGNTPH